jgi:hypothetical protein
MAKKGTREMNANELAEALDDLDLISGYKVVAEAQTMLRQQQAEIEALKKEAALQRLSDFTQESESFDRTASHMAGEYVSYSEPVAWGWYDLEIKRFFPHWDEDLMENKEGCIPLYTHPTKTLTDEEIEEVYQSNQFEGYIRKNDCIDFARAILRKVQEK